MSSVGTPGHWARRLDSAPGRSRPLWRRILARTFAGLWRQKRALIVGGGMAALGAHAVRSLPSAPSAAPGGAGSPNRGDCADITMSAMAQRTPATAQQAYQCLEPSFQQQVSEQQFASQLQGTIGPSVTRVARVATYREPNGAALVYYALDGNGQSIGYIVYLGADGKVLKVE